MNSKASLLALLVTAVAAPAATVIAEPEEFEVSRLVDLGDAFEDIQAFACGFASERRQFVFKRDSEGELHLVGPDLETASFMKTGNTFTVIDEEVIYQISDRASMKSTNGEAVQGDCLDMTQDLWTVAHALAGQNAALVPDLEADTVRLLENQLTTQRSVLKGHIDRLRDENRQLRQELEEAKDRRAASNATSTGSRRSN